ncbi:MAG: tetratricopeptide repeat protein [Nitrospinae bacterium]|nr:tetratricopeptide repeat protein [Nitrospinota bacterium]
MIPRLKPAPTSGIRALAVIVFFITAMGAGGESSAGPPPAHPGQDTLSLRQKAEAAIFRKQYEEAIELYRDILQTQKPGSYDFRGLVRAYRGAGRLPEAEGHIRDYLSSHPQSSPALYGYGYCLYQLGQNPGAIEYFREAIQQEPENALALNNLGAALARDKEYPEAVDKIKKAVAISPDEPMFFHNLKSVYESMGTPERFLAEYREYLKDGPKPLAAGYGKAIAVALRQEGFRLYSEGKADETLRKFSDMVQVYREIDHVPGVVAGLFSLGTLYEEMGDAQNAEKYYREVLRINPGHIQAREKVKNLP